jgi:hypothetical protein
MSCRIGGALVCALVLTSPASAGGPSSVTGTVTYLHSVNALRHGYAFEGPAERMGASGPMLFLTASPVDEKKVASARGGAARLETLADLTADHSIPLLFVFQDGDGWKAKWIDQGDVFGTRTERPDIPVIADLPRAPWTRTREGRLQGALESARATSVTEGLAFELEFDVALLKDE